MGLFDSFKKKSVENEGNELLDEKKTYEQTFLEIVNIISGGDKDVVSETFECISDTEHYLEVNSEQYEERGIDESDDIELTQWIGMVDILQKYNYVCERDWKDGLDDFIYFIENLIGTKTHKLSVNKEWFNINESIIEWCNILDEKWEQQEICVAGIDIGSDSYVLFPCKVTELEQLKKCSEKINQRIDFAKDM